MIRDSKFEEFEKVELRLDTDERLGGNTELYSSNENTVVERGIVGSHLLEIEVEERSEENDEEELELFSLDVESIKKFS